MKSNKREISPEMVKLRKMLTAKGILWKDVSDPHIIMNDKDYIIYRTRFLYKNFLYSIIFGNGTYGENNGLLECMRKDLSLNKVDEPVGHLTANEIYNWIVYDKNPKELTYGIALYSDQTKLVDYVEVKATNKEEAQKLAFNEYIKKQNLKSRILMTRKDG